MSGKASATEYLKTLGAKTVLLRQEIDFGSRPLEAARFAGAIDNVGGEMLTWLTRTVDFWGNIASIGLAGSAELKTTVMLFILRGVSLLGINSAATPRAKRTQRGAVRDRRRGPEGSGIGPAAAFSGFLRAV